MGDAPCEECQRLQDRIRELETQLDQAQRDAREEMREAESRHRDEMHDMERNLDRASREGGGY